MNNEARNFSAIPAQACRLSGGEVSIGDNGDGAKTAPVKLKARSGQPIEHWYWGNVVHDLAGMRTHKPRLTVDYAHNDSEVLGYLNHFDATSGDLIASGALTPFREDDRASEVLYKMRQGVPYEASIFFGGDGIKIEEVGEGMVAQVNGYQFAGPGVIIREWPLRGVAICPYGADQNTESAAMSAGNETYTATTITKQSEGEQKMNADGTVEAKTEATEGKPVEAAPVVEAEVKPEAIPAELAAQPVAAPAVAVVEAPANELAAKLADADKAAADALVKLAAVTAERDEALRKLAALTAGAAPLSAAPAPEAKELTPWQKAQKAARK